MMIIKMMITTRRKMITAAATTILIQLCKFVTQGKLRQRITEMNSYALFSKLIGLKVIVYSTSWFAFTTDNMVTSDKSTYVSVPLISFNSAAL